MADLKEDYYFQNLQISCMKVPEYLLIYSNYYISRPIYLLAISKWNTDEWLVHKVAWLRKYLNYSLHRITFSTSLSYLSVYCLQLKVYHKESDSKH